MAVNKDNTTFKRNIGTAGQIFIAVATISPVAGVFVNIQGTLGVAGTGMLWAYLIAAIITWGVAFTYSEMGAMYPYSGGLYSIARNVLGPTLGFVVLMDYLIQAVFMPATIALGAAQYFAPLFPSLSLSVLGFIVMLIVTIIALLSTSLEAKFTGFFVILEILLMTVLTVSSIFHMHQNLSIYTHPTALSGGHDVAATWGLVITATAISLFSYNGYDSALNVSEETNATPRKIGVGVVKAATIAIVFQVIPIFFMLLATPSIPNLLSSKDPLSFLGATLFGKNASVIFDVAAGFAILNSTLGVTIQFSRILYSSARDHVWPSAMSNALQKLHKKTGSPYVAVLVIGIIGLVMTFFSSFLFDLAFIGVIVVALYFFISIAAIVSKVRDRNLERAYKAPLGYLFPLLALIGSVFVLTQQSGQSLLISLILFVIGALYYLTLGRVFAKKARTVGSPDGMHTHM